MTFNSYALRWYGLILFMIDHIRWLLNRFFYIFNQIHDTTIHVYMASVISWSYIRFHREKLIQWIFICGHHWDISNHKSLPFFFCNFPKTEGIIDNSMDFLCIKLVPSMLLAIVIYKWKFNNNRRCTKLTCWQAPCKVTSFLQYFKLSTVRSLEKFLRVKENRKCNVVKIHALLMCLILFDFLISRGSLFTLVKMKKNEKSCKSNIRRTATVYGVNKFHRIIFNKVDLKYDRTRP